MVNSSNTRAWAQAALCAVVLSGCGAGQQVQTATMQPALNGASATLGDIALRNIRIHLGQASGVIPPGRAVDLALVATNQSQETADTLVAVTSDVGAVTAVGNAAIPAEGILIVDDPNRLAHARALAAVKPANVATATVTLGKPISDGLIYEFTFRFAHAGRTTVDVPVAVE